MKIISIPKKEIYQWGLFAEAYFASAIFYLKHLESTQNDDCKFKHLISSRAKIVILYNAKHGLELFLKFLHLIFDGSSGKTHDFDWIFKKIDGKVKAINSVQIIEIAKKLSTSKEEVMKFFTVMNEEIKGIVKKYQNFPPAIIATKNIIDKENVFFKYPDLESEFGINLTNRKVLQDINTSTIVEDLEKLNMFNWSIMILFGKNSKGKGLI